ncbi:FAD dependent oxidoreductase [Basidiobolus meristosporus CBS 931.73]|uniref:FAD dependent oxidoreductase n=1 Tax=Basidiobolus meristosporus CBS 931.73 TaxID=1314790 RepID=A0A1Y1Y1Y8_9FUNG|nr:FAD dependent oxidoreductase [Basidiobolus meristosporus CBS 931.73]|eukprot:ORX92010.1 FAD dependent oxidoreductase [Basidiobolus meristosporus CBS 931.73]
MSNIVVIGAGVIGVTTAYTLQKAGYQVTIVAEHFPGEFHSHYTSPWAGAHWRSVAAQNDIAAQQYDAISFGIFQQLAKNPETGVMLTQETNFWEKLPHNWQQPWFAKFSPNYRVLSKEEIPEDCEYGVTYTTATISTTEYMKWLLAEFEQLGGKKVVKKLANISDAFDQSVQAVINCTGLLARTLGGVEDLSVYPTRGQVVLVRAPHIRQVYLKHGASNITYIIPRNNGEVTLGGTTQAGDWNEKPDSTTAAAIIERCISLCPSLAKDSDSKNLEIIRHGVGFRPTRIGGIRLESEIITHKGQPIIVCHNYGHGGFGFQSSWGSAQTLLSVLKRAEESLEAKHLVSRL